MASEPRSNLGDRITFSPADREHFDELAELRIAAMRESLERVGRFTPERARQRLQNSFYPEHTRFILLDGAKVGFYTFRPEQEEFRLEHLYIHPSHQSRGVGSHVLAKLLEEADALRKPVFLGALRESASNRFYQRHGFEPIREDEWDIYYMRPTQK